MILVSPDLRERLLVNGRRSGLDHVPVVKFINPLGIGTWLATELDQDDDSCSVSPISATPSLDRSASRRWRRCPCRSAWLSNATFCSRGLFPLSVYAEAARQAGSIVCSERLLRAAAAALQRER